MYSNIYTAQDHLLQVAPSHGGYCNLYIVPIQHITAWPPVNPLTGLLDAAPTLATGKTWLNIENMPGNAVYREEEQESDAGDWYSMSVTAPMADDNTQQFLRTLALRYNRFAVLVEEHNGLTRLVGSSSAGARIKQSYTSADDDGTRQRILTISWENDSPAMLLSAEALLNIEFSNEYSYEFN